MTNAETTTTNAETTTTNAETTTTDEDTATTDEDTATTDETKTATDVPATLVAATGEHAGKTAIALALARIAAGRGARVGYMKPKGTRLRSKVGKTLDQDPMLAREVLGLDAEMHQMEPVVYSPTFIEGAIRGAEEVAVIHDRIREEYLTLATGCDHMFIEGGGNWTTGGIVELTDADVAELLGADVVLVAGYETPGDLDEVLAAAASFGDRLSGVIFNKVSDPGFDSLERDGIPFLESRGITVFGVLPRETTLAGVTVGELAEEIGAELVTDVPTDGFVERFLVGAMSGDEALRHFRRARNAAVVTGGDRADIQAAAMEASGVSCLVLTGGHHPSGAVRGAAAEAEMPILAVTTDTATAIDRIEAVVSGGRTRDARTVERMAELLLAHVDVDALM